MSDTFHCSGCLRVKDIEAKAEPVPGRRPVCKLCQGKIQRRLAPKLIRKPSGASYVVSAEEFRTVEINYKNKHRAARAEWLIKNYIPQE